LQIIIKDKKCNLLPLLVLLLKQLSSIANISKTNVYGDSVMRYCHIYFIATVASFSLLGCATTGSLQKAPVREPIMIGTHGTETITFRGVIIRVLAGTKIGSHHDGLLKVPQFPYTWNANISSGDYEFNLAASEQLRRYGYSVLGGDNLLFGQDQSSKAMYQLGGVITNIMYNSFGVLAGNYTEAQLTVEWQLFNALEKNIVFQTTTTGYGKESGTSLAAIYSAFRQALNSLLAEEQFASILVKKVNVVGLPPEPNKIIPISLQTNTKSIKLPQDLEIVFESVVTLRVGASIASGFIISPDGYILTAAHVVSGVSAANVRLKSGLTMNAEVVRIDENQDIALLKMPGFGFNAVALYTDRRSEIGTEVYAIGTPFGEEFAYSVSKGIVSGYRTWQEMSFIQTDASLNPGNSGGPLLNAQGQVLGIVSWKIAIPGFEGLAFGVPISVVEQRLGIDWQQVDQKENSIDSPTLKTPVANMSQQESASTSASVKQQPQTNPSATKDQLNRETLLPNFRAKVPESTKYSDKEILDAYRKKFPNLKNVNDEKLIKMIEEKYK
jgi:S1-C subfamily serine protease